MITKATTTKITMAVFLSKPETGAGVGVAIASVLKVTVVVTGGINDEWSLFTSSAFKVWFPYGTSL